MLHAGDLSLVKATGQLMQLRLAPEVDPATLVNQQGTISSSVCSPTWLLLNRANGWTIPMYPDYPVLS